MSLKRLALRVGVVMALATMIGGCCILPFDRGGRGVYRGYGDGSGSHREMERPGFDGSGSGRVR